jgi:hypothetical protein
MHLSVLLQEAVDALAIVRAAAISTGLWAVRVTRPRF